MPKCTHCLLAVPSRAAVYEDINGATKIFCCPGCRGIYRLIHQEGLSRFYAQRRWENGGFPSPSSPGDIDLVPFAELVRSVAGQSEIDLFIEGIRCTSCVWLNEKMLAKLAGIDYVKVNYATHRARIRWDVQVLDLETILKRIQAIGYRAKPWSESEQFRLRKSETKALLLRFTTAAFLSSQSMVLSIALYAGYFQGIDGGTKFTLEIIILLLTLPVIFYAGCQFIKNSISGLWRLQFSMDSLVTLGAGSAFIFSSYSLWRGGEVYFDTAGMIITFSLLGRLIELSAKGKASETIERLAALSPREARLITPAGEQSKVPIAAVQEGDLLKVVPGERIPLDGIVRSGSSEVDEALITGEAKPVLKKAGDEVIGGSMNLYGALIFAVTKTGKETVLAGIIRIVQDAQAARPKIQTAADQVVAYFVPAVLGIALAAVLFHLFRGMPTERALMTGIAILVIACPCSLGLATPLAVQIFSSLAAAAGILVKNGELVEKAGKINHIVFDKTGTITHGRPTLRETILLDQSLTKDDVIALAAAVEDFSEHSIGHAVAAAARNLPATLSAVTVADFQAVPGKGVKGKVKGDILVIGNQEMLRENGISLKYPSPVAAIAAPFERDGDTIIYLGWRGALRAMMVVSDTMREEVPVVVSELQRKLQCPCSLVSGDNDATTRAIARWSGIERVVSGVSPVEKREVIRSLQQKGATVMMVGDGINDAPALIQATAGVAMGRGNEIAMESADAVLIRNDLSLLPDFIRLSRKTYRVIKQNIFWAFLYNLIALPLAFASLLHPIIAAGAMTMSSLFVVGNSLRIGKNELFGISKKID